jgi:hypothetical protein
MAQGMRKGKKLDRKGQLFLCIIRLKRDFRLQVFQESVFPIATISNFYEYLRPVEIFATWFYRQRN